MHTLKNLYVVKYTYETQRFSLVFYNCPYSYFTLGLSYTLVVRNYEKKVKATATRLIKRQNPGLSKDDQEALVKTRTRYILDSTKDKPIYPVIGTTYQKAKENELNLGLDLQGGISVTMDVALEGLLKSLSNNSTDPSLLSALKTLSIIALYFFYSRTCSVVMIKLFF